MESAEDEYDESESNEDEVADDTSATDEDAVYDTSETDEDPPPAIDDLIRARLDALDVHAGKVPEEYGKGAVRPPWGNTQPSSNSITGRRQYPSTQPLLIKLGRWRRSCARWRATA